MLEVASLQRLVDLAESSGAMLLVDETYRDRDRLLPPILQDVRARLAVVQAWLDGQDTFEWVPPRGGAVGFVRFRPGVTVDTGVFYRRLLADHGTYVGAGHWFEVSDRYFRLGYAWPTRTELRDGLAGLTAAAGQART
jgi:DNA-binding transcriptional MocR family regulator